MLEYKNSDRESSSNSNSSFSEEQELFLKIGDKYLCVDSSCSSSVIAESCSQTQAQTWILELRKTACLTIRTADSSMSYLCLTGNNSLHRGNNSSSSSSLSLVSCLPSKATRWEF